MSLSDLEKSEHKARTTVARVVMLSANDVMRTAHGHIVMALVCLHDMPGTKSNEGVLALMEIEPDSPLQKNAIEEFQKLLESKVDGVHARMDDMGRVM